MHSIILLIFGYLLLIISTLTKLVFFIMIKSRKEKKLSTFYKSFKTRYLNQTLHNADENPSRMLFMKSSNIINVFWWAGFVIAIINSLTFLFDLF